MKVPHNISLKRTQQGHLTQPSMLQVRGSLSGGASPCADLPLVAVTSHRATNTSSCFVLAGEL